MTMMGLVIAGVSGLSGFLFGYDTAVIAGALAPMADHFGLDTGLKETVVSSILVGALVGALSAGSIADRFGQRRTLLIGAIMFVVFALLLAMAESTVTVLIWRTALGLAVGLASMVAPLYVAESAPADARGALVSLFQLGVTVGILASYIAGYQLADDGDWRIMLGLGAAPAVLLLSLLLLLPESPRWLALKGRGDEAAAALRRVRSREDVTAELAEISVVDVTPLSWRDLIGPQLRPVLIVAAGLFMFQNLSGIDGILYYAPEIFKTVGFQGDTGALVATIGLGAINAGATVAAMLLVDRWGRRPLLYGGLAVMIVSLTVMSGLLLFAGDVADMKADDYVTVICLSIYVTAFALSLGPLPFVLMSEVFPLAARSRGMSIAAASAWLLNLLVSFTFLTLLEALGTGGTFLLYAGICGVALIFSVALVPETKGRTLEHIEANLAAGRRTRDLGKVNVS